MTEINEALAWEKAKSKVEILGDIPPVFTLAIRSLMYDFNKSDNESISTASQFLVSRLMLSPTMKSIVYHAVLTFKNEHISNIAHVTSWELIRTFKPGDLAMIIAAVYIYAKLNKLLNTDDIQTTKEMISFDLDFAGYIGECVPSITGMACTFLAAILPMSKILVGLEQGNSDKNKSINLYELVSAEIEATASKYQTTGMHVCCSLLQKFGFGIPWANSIMSVYSNLLNPPSPITKSEKLDSISLKLLAANIWMKSLKENNAVPNFKIPAEFYPTTANSHRLLYLSDNLNRNGSKYSWIARTKQDISPTLTPQLYQEYLSESASTEEITNFCGQHLPEEIASELKNIDSRDLSKSILDEDK